MQLILGSSSPRRKEVLQFFSLSFTQAISSFPEEEVPFLGDPISYVTTLAQGKGRLLQQTHSDAAILTGDTVVFCEDKIYNKPKDLAEATEFLTILSGKWSSVFTALALTTKEKELVLVEETKLLFRTLSLEQITHYLHAVPFLDKAGGFAIQRGGALVIEKIDGCYYNVMGMPLGALSTLLHTIGIDLWERIHLL